MHMFEMLVGGFLLTGSICPMEGAVYRPCRDIPQAQYGNKYVCDRRVETIVSSLSELAPARLGFEEGGHLKVQAKCTAAHMAGI